MENKILLDSNVLNSIYIQRLATNEYRSILPYLDNIENFITDRLIEEGDSITSAYSYVKLRNDIQKELDKQFEEWKEGYFNDFPEILSQQAEFSQMTLSRVAPIFESVVPSDEQLLKAAYKIPMVLGVDNNADVIDIKPFVDGFTDDQIEKMQSTIRRGWIQGQTTAQIIRDIRGTKKTKGVLDYSRKSAEAVVRTSVNHLANLARQETYKANDELITGYQLLATLDFRTSNICKGFDQQIFYYKDKYNPLPPFHPNCRTSHIPVLADKYILFGDDGLATRASKGVEGGKQVNGNFDYYEWVKTQPAYGQDQALGKTRGLIFRNSGLTIEEFKAASYDQLNRPLTINQMRDKNKTISKYLDKIGYESN